MSRDPLADEVWRAMTALLCDNRDSWKRAAVDQTGLNFSRIRILRRLVRGPMSLKEIAHATIVDAPAATVAVNDLEDHGLVMRQVVPANRRCKMVSLTDVGWAMVAKIDAIDGPGHEALAALDEKELRAIREAIVKLSGHTIRSESPGNAGVSITTNAVNFVGG